MIVEENQIVRTDFTMQVGQVSQTLTVRATTPPIITDDPALSETVSLRATEDLPLNGRDSLRLATITPTVLPGLKIQRQIRVEEEILSPPVPAKYRIPCRSMGLAS